MLQVLRKLVEECADEAGQPKPPEPKTLAKAQDVLQRYDEHRNSGV